jgi:transcriptional regulator with XRE-family HTH domain
MTDTTPGDRLKAAREQRGLILDDVAYLVRHGIGDRFSRETLRRYEAGEVPVGKWRTHIMAVVCVELDVDPSTIDADLGARVEHLLALLAGGVTARYPQVAAA